MQTLEGTDPRASAQANSQRGEANASHHRRNRQWAKEHPGQRDRAWFLREVTPKLDAFSLAEIAKATGLSLAACSRFRAGTRVPHSRHWEAFLALVKRVLEALSSAPNRRCPTTTRCRAATLALIALKIGRAARSGRNHASVPASAHAVIAPTTQSRSHKFLMVALF